MRITIVIAAVLTLGWVTASIPASADEAPKADAPKADSPKAADSRKAPSDAPAATAVIDKAVEALGGKDKLGAIKAATWTSKGTITIGGTDAPFTATLAFVGHDRRRVEFATDLGGNAIKGVVVINGDKGWRQFNGNTEELAGKDLANEQRNGWREWTAADVLLLKSPPFKAEPADDAEVNGKPAATVKVTGPHGAPFTLYFDKASGLPVRQTATVTTFSGDEAAEEVTYSEYKDFGGIKKATKVETKHDGQRLLIAEVTQFKVLDKPEPRTFDKPE
jgi:hypothetical protein